MDLLINIDSFQATTTLARVENGSIDDLLSCPRYINITSYVCGIFATKFESNIHNSICCCLSCSQTTSYRSSEAHESYFWISNNRFNNEGRAAMEVLDDIIWKASFRKDRCHVFNNCRSLRRWLENDRVTSEKSRYQRVDENKIGVLKTKG